MTRLQLLLSLSARLYGVGVEFGAGSLPFPLPERVRVRYADRNTVAHLREKGTFGDAPLTAPALQSDLESMAGIEDASLDFIIASHVIEHTRNPLRVLEQAYRKLRMCGQLILVVPDKEATFDRDRALTNLPHLILDFESPSRERDWDHYIEYFTKACPQPDPVLAAQGPFEQEHDIHFHTWTYESFGEMLNYARQSISPWTSVWSKPRLTEKDIEFYYLLRK